MSTFLGSLFQPKDTATTTTTTTASSGDGISQTVTQTDLPQAAPPQQALDQAQKDQSLVSKSVNPILAQDMSALSHLDPRSSQILQHAFDEAKRVKQTFIEPEHLFLSLIADREVFKLLQDFSVDVAKLTRELQAKEEMGSASTDPTLGEQTKQILEESFANAKKREVEFVSPEDILLTYLSKETVVAAPLKTQGLEKAKVEEKLSKTTEFKTGKKSVLGQFGVDLTQKAKDGKLDPVTGRDIEIERMIHILLRRTKNNPIIIGEAGTGKTAIVEGLAQMMVSGKVSPDLASKRIIQLDVSSLVAGASHRGEFEERLQNVIKETMDAAGQIILFIDEIHTIIGAGDSGGSLDASNIVKPYLSRGQLQIIGTTTTAEYRKNFEKDRAFERRFQPIMCEEPSEDVALDMIKILQQKYESFHKVTFSPEAIQSAVHLSKRYIGERYLPDKAIDLLDEASAEVKLNQASGKRQDTIVKPTDVESVVSRWTGIPITKLTEKESEKLLHMEDLIHKKFVNHERAVMAVAEAVRRGRIGLANANRPIASFIFLGPTGTGKTELAKILAEIMFGRPDAMVRLDMSEYMEKHEVAKLIGAPPGYVGYEEGGRLTEAVRNKPYQIVLLDEIEKAHPDVFNILLQLLEDGRLTDNKGNTISFKNTVVIATSNIASGLINQKLKDVKEDEAAAAAAAITHPQVNGTPAVAQPGQPSVVTASTVTPAPGVGQPPATTNPAAPVPSGPSFGVPPGGVTPPQSPVNGPTPTVPATGPVPNPGGTGSSVSTPKDLDEKKAKLYQELSKTVMEELTKHFRPELINRFDEVVIFEPLTMENMMIIAKLGIDGTKKMLKDQNIGLEISQTALRQLAKEGYDPAYGARPLRRLIQRSIENPIAIYLIQKTIVAGDTILIDYNPEKDHFVFSKAANTQPPVNGATPPSATGEPANGTPAVPNPVMAPPPPPPNSTMPVTESPVEPPTPTS